MRVLAAVASGWLLCGCSGALAKGDGRAFGDDLGRFHVTAMIDSSTCGPKAMDAPEKWDFDVVLSKQAPSIYWNTGADAVEGTLAADGKTFAFTAETVVNVDSGNAAQNPGSASAPSSCTVVRNDDSSGELDAAESAKAFTGTLGYRFASQGTSDCSALFATGGFAALPCSMTYRMSGIWVSAR
jgi:hypothetical protein